MKQIPTVTTYLEMLTPCMPHVAEPGVTAQIERLSRPSVEEYRRLYNTTGKEYHWVDRNRIPDPDLQSILNDDAVHIYGLRADGQIAGFAELDGRLKRDIELAYFGLFPDYIGQGLGKYFLYLVLKQAWSTSPARVWLHTCDLDHPAALPNYVKTGFTVYDRQTVQQRIPE